MAVDDHALEPRQEWLVRDATGSPATKASPTLDQVRQLASELNDDERSQLAYQLWDDLPAHYRANFIRSRFDEICDVAGISTQGQLKKLFITFWNPVRDALFDPSKISELYSAPRRFDLTTIFVATAALSLLLGTLSTIGTQPAIIVFLACLIAIIAAAQAFFEKVANPRGVSIVTGATFVTLFFLGLSLFNRWALLTSLLLDVVIRRRSFSGPSILLLTVLGCVFGAFVGYLFGALVGGVFLLADLLRGKFKGTKAAGLSGTESSTETTLDTETVNERT
jgi:hypothetical protein